MPRFDITIAGEVNLDIILYGLPDDLPQERELLANGCCVTLGSSSAITAHNLSVLGSKVGFITRVGQDDLGKIALSRMTAVGVDLGRITESHEADTGLTMILPHSRSRHILTNPGCMAEMKLEHLDMQYLTSSRHFHLSSFFLHRGLVRHIPQLFKRLKEAGLTISLDTNDDPEDRWADTLPEALRYVDILMPNEREACKIAGTSDFEDAIGRLSKFVPFLVVKMGSKGSMAVRGNERILKPALAVEVVDPVGAGDSFNSGFLHKYVQCVALEDCLAYGNMTAAFSTTYPGGTEAFRKPGLWEQFRESHASI